MKKFELKQKNSRSFLRLITLMLKHPKPLTLGFLMIFSGTTALLLEPRLIGLAIDQAIVPRNWEILRRIVIVYFFVVVIRAGSTIQQGYYFETLGQRVTQDLRMDLFSHLNRMPVSIFQKVPSGSLMTRLTSDIISINEMFTNGFISISANILQAIGIFFWLLILNLKLGLISFSVFPALILLSVIFSKKLRKAYSEVRSQLALLNSFLAENLAGIKVIHLFNRQKVHLRKFNEFNQKYADVQMGSIQVFALFQPSITIAAGIAIALVIGFGGNAVDHGTLKVGVLVTYFAYVLSLFQPIREIADKWNIFLSGMASLDRIFSILIQPVELNEDSIYLESKCISNLVGEIQFENVWFAYQGEDWVIKDFSIHIKAGEKIGIVGHTGAGKSTLMSLLNRFYDPQKGRILLDGKDLRSYEVRSLRASIGVIQQEAFLFAGNFLDNLTFWQNISVEKLDPLLELLGIQSFQRKLLSERGTNLSMGEKQLLAFARAALKEPKIWILDEATSNMDLKTESILQKALEQISPQQTKIIIAHRLATVQSSSRIIVLNQGNLVESGTHAELLRLNGLYARLYRYLITC